MSSGVKIDNKKPIVTINLTPLVDVSLVLVVIFMATAPMFLQSGIIVTSAAGKKAEAAASGQAPAPKNIVVRLTSTEILLNQKPVPMAELPRLLRQMLSISQDGRVIIQPDREVRHGQVVKVMDIAKQSGAASLVIYGKTQKTGSEK